MGAKRHDKDAWIVLRKPSRRALALLTGAFLLACLLGYFGGKLLN